MYVYVHIEYLQSTHKTVLTVEASGEQRLPLLALEVSVEVSGGHTWKEDLFFMLITLVGKEKKDYTIQRKRNYQLMHENMLNLTSNSGNIKIKVISFPIIKFKVVLPQQSLFSALKGWVKWLLSYSVGGVQLTQQFKNGLWQHLSKSKI